MKPSLFDRDNWREIGATLSRNKTRTFLTGFGIFWGVAMLAVLMGGASGGEGMLRRNFAGFATNSGGIIPDRTAKPYMGFQKGRSWNLKEDDILLIREYFPEFKAVVPVYQKWGISMKTEKNSYSGQIVGAEENYPEVAQPKILSGRFINCSDVANGRHIAVIGKKAATQLFPDKEHPEGETVNADGVAYTVVGVADDTSDMSINGRVSESMFIPSSTFRTVNGYGKKVDFMMVVGNGNTDIAEPLERVRRFLLRRHDIDPTDTSALMVLNIAEMFEKVDMVFTGIDLLAVFIGFSSLIAGIIGIGNIMWVIVKERTQEIGIRRALGATPADIIVQILCEGAVLTFLAGTGGLVSAVGILEVLQRKFNPPDAVLPAQFQLPLEAAAGILATFIILGMLAALIPSFKAMKIKPVEAINSK